MPVRATRLLVLLVQRALELVVMKWMVDYCYTKLEVLLGHSLGHSELEKEQRNYVHFDRADFGCIGHFVDRDHDRYRDPFHFDRFHTPAALGHIAQCCFQSIGCPHSVSFHLRPAARTLYVQTSPLHPSAADS